MSGRRVYCQQWRENHAQGRVLRDTGPVVLVLVGTTAGRVGGECTQMTTKALKRSLVGFYSTSPRIAHAYRSAAKRNKSLARLAVLHELGHAAATHEVLRHAQGFEIVVLSHADDDHFVLTDSRIEPVVSGAFHLLFTEPAT